MELIAEPYGHKPYRIDITKAVKQGENKIKLK